MLKNSVRSILKLLKPCIWEQALVNENIIEIIKKGIDIYNKYRDKEAHSSLIDVKQDLVRIRFEGHFCRSCGVYDWIDDFRYILEDLGIETHLEEVIESEEDEDQRIGVLRIRSFHITEGVNRYE